MSNLFKFNIFVHTRYTKKIKVKLKLYEVGTRINERKLK